MHIHSCVLYASKNSEMDVKIHIKNVRIQKGQDLTMFIRLCLIWIAIKDPIAKIFKGFLDP